MTSFMSVVIGFCFLTAISVVRIHGLSAQISSSDDDAGILLGFKQQVTGDPLKALAGWGPDAAADPCSWNGVNCTSSRVTGLTLNSFNLIANASAIGELSRLEMLSFLSLAGNNFSGALSEALSFNNDVGMKCSYEFLDLSANSLCGQVTGNAVGSCKVLKSLNLSNNQLTDGIPAGVLGGLQLNLLDLSHNNLSGAIPGDIVVNCSNLEYLDLSYNNFSQGLPGGFSACPKLGYVDLSCNSLAGVIPFDFSATLFSHLNLSYNKFMGIFPSSLLNCTQLQVLSLAHNQFIGEIPSYVGSLQLLQDLDLGANNFSGPFPLAVLNCSSLMFLDLSSNQFSGIIPAEICPVSSQLKWLWLQDNGFYGSIPPQISNCSQLISLDLSFNNLSGTIPGDLQKLTNLESLVLWFNNFEGQIPVELANLTNLQNLILNNNNLQGSIPAELSNCSMLQWLSLSDNNLTGTIPPSLFNLPRLGVLQLGNNKLTGVIPPEIKNSVNLFWLDLCLNNLNGTIPAQLGRTSRSANGIVDNCEMAFMTFLDASCKGIGGLIDTAGIRLSDLSAIHNCRTRLYNLDREELQNAPTLVFLDLSHNAFEGSIPSDIGDFYSLNILNLDHNSLSGELPGSLGECAQLMALDLSSNDLSGPIPESFTNLTLLQDFNISNNNLSGKVPGGPLLAWPPSVYANNPGLCGLPLPNLCVSISLNQTAHSKSSWRGGRADHVVMVLFISLGVILVLLWTLWLRRKSLKYCLKARTEEITSSSVRALKNEDQAISVATFDFGLQEGLKKLTFGDLLEATNNFSSECILGSGGFGEVYKAKLRDGSLVAVKKLIYLTNQGERGFLSEMETLGNVKHKNLVQLLGYCITSEDRILIYEFMPHGSLERMLHGECRIPQELCSGEQQSLSWAARKVIAVGAARGLAYLHHGCDPHIIHRDFKSANVLLDADFEARVCDFGMARFISSCETHLSVSTLAGTPGYVPPEYYQSFRCSRQGDVYSYGVVLLELITGRCPTDKDEFGDSNLVGWTKLKLHDEAALNEIFDPTLQHNRAGKCNNNAELVQYLRIACDCLEDNPANRPTMLQVVATLKEISLDCCDFQ